MLLSRREGTALSGGDREGGVSGGTTLTNGGFSASDVSNTHRRAVDVDSPLLTTGMLLRRGRAGSLTVGTGGGKLPRRQDAADGTDSLSLVQCEWPLGAVSSV